MNLRNMTNYVLDAQNVCKTYIDGGKKTEVLHGLNLQISKGESVAIIGSSGSGKSTLLHLLGGLDTPTEGDIYINGTNLRGLNETQLGDLRNQHLGFVYQFHHLLPEFTALENVAMPLLMRKNSNIEQVKAVAADIIGKVGLKNRLDHKPSMLSGGERQRIAIARALVTQPSLVMADEPTGNLDHANADAVFGLLKDLQSELGMALLMVTHDTELASRVDRTMQMKDGKWVE